MDDTEISLLPDSIYREIFHALAELRGAARKREKCFSWTASPHPVWGRACFDLDLEGADEDDYRALARKARELGCRISTGPSDKPGNAEALLEGAGFVRAFQTAGMVLEKGAFRPRPAPSGLSIDPVLNDRDWLDWSGVVCCNLFTKDSSEDAAEFALIGQALASSGKFRAYLGRDGEGKAAATSAAFDCASGTGGVFYVATEATARKRGYGAALTSAASADCFTSGFAYATLSATEGGHPVYLGLGYRDVSVLGRYLPPEA